MLTFAVQALAQVDDDDAAGRRLGEQRQHGRILRRIAHPEREQDQRPHWLLQDVGDHLGRDARIEGHHTDGLGVMSCSTSGRSDGTPSSPASSEMAMPALSNGG